MLHFLSSRLSVAQRVLLVAACAAPPVVLLLYLFVDQTERDYRFTAEELKGAAYIAEIWPAIVAGGEAGAAPNWRGPADRAQEFGAAKQAQAFLSAPPQARLTRGVDFIQGVADGSNLTLDTDLSSFYAMDAATVAMPRLLVTVMSAQAGAFDPFTLGKAQSEEQAVLRDLDEAIGHLPTAEARSALAAQPRQLAAAFDAFMQSPRDAARRSQLVAAVDSAWRIDDRELTRLLEARRKLILERLWSSLALIAVTLAAAAAMAVALTRAMDAQLKALLGVMDRLNAGDTAVQVPYLQDRTEAGRVAATLEAFRRGLIEAEEERRRGEQANAAVRESEARYRMLADNSGDVILHYDPDFEMIYVSPSVRQFGYGPEQVKRLELADIVHPEDLPTVLWRRALASQGAETKPIAIRLGTADRRWLWFEGTLTAVRDEHGAIAGFISTFRDIHERKLAEQALIDSEARYRMLAENITDVMLRYDADLCIDYVSPSVRQWGYTAEDFIGQRAGVFIHPDDKDRIALRRSAMLAGEPVQSVEARICRADGSWTWIESNPALIRDKNGAVLGVVLVLRDINQRKLAEAALIESEARYRMLADNTSDIIQRFDADGVVQYISPSVRQLGYEPEFFIGRPTAQLVDREDMAEVVRRRQDLLSGRPVPPLESRSHTADGRVVWLESRPSAILDEHGKLIGVVNVMRDVTERKAAESAMQELNLELRRVARASALGAFAGSLAHEINQPLAAAAVSGEAALRWLSAEPANLDRGLQATRRVVEAVRRAADVVGRMRALVTKEEPERLPFDAHDAIVEVLALTARESERSSVVLRTRLDAERSLISGDRVQFQQVMINLILNAIEAMREVDGERLLVVGSRDAADGLEVFVEDRGPGVAPDQQSRIFESLFTTKIGGTGLGLAIVKSIVESHGGAITLTPATPHGAVFEVRLPRFAAETGPGERLSSAKSGHP